MPSTEYPIPLQLRPVQEKLRLLELTVSLKLRGAGDSQEGQIIYVSHTPLGDQTSRPVRRAQLQRCSRAMGQVFLPRKAGILAPAKGRT